VSTKEKGIEVARWPMAIAPAGLTLSSVGRASWPVAGAAIASIGARASGDSLHRPTPSSAGRERAAAKPVLVSAPTVGERRGPVYCQN